MENLFILVKQSLSIKQNFVRGEKRGLRLLCKLLHYYRVPGREYGAVDG